MAKKPLAQVTIAQIEVTCGNCHNVIPGQTGVVRLSGSSAEDIVRQIQENVKNTPYHNAYSLRAEIQCDGCGEVNRVPKNWQRNIW